MIPHEVSTIIYMYVKLLLKMMQGRECESQIFFLFSWNSLSLTDAHSYLREKDDKAVNFLFDAEAAQRDKIQ